MTERWQLFNGDCIEELKKLPERSIDSVVCDPPYGLSEPPNAWEVMKYWTSNERYEHKKAGFMGKEWDAFVPGPEYWFEVERVMKPGAHAIIFAGTRTWDYMSIAARMAGLELVDTLMWLYGQGFPKSLDISKAIDKAVHAEREVIGTKKSGIANPKEKGRHTIGAGKAVVVDVTTPSTPSTPSALAWDGWGTALKPAWEPAMLFQKPVAHKHVAGNVVKWGTGGLNIDASRVGSDVIQTNGHEGDKFAKYKGGEQGESVQKKTHVGRWPANVVLAHTPECKVIGVKAVGSGAAKIGVARTRNNGVGLGAKEKRKGAASAPDSYGTETVEAWECSPDCAVAELDRQTGTLRSGPNPKRRGTDKTRVALGAFKGQEECAAPRGEDLGGASRFFYCAKVSTSERNEGLEDMADREVHRYGRGLVQGHDPDAPAIDKNHHPTVKPLKLMRYLCRLITPPGGVVLDPFSGSGSTGVAALQEGFRFIGVEREPDFAEIARKRLKAAEAKNEPVSQRPSV